jgi:hypothetical protein
MTWLGVLIAVAVAVALFGLTGARVKGGRPVGRTRLMSAARVVLVILAAVVAYAAWAG